MNIWWTRLPVGDGRWLVYSPLFGRTYLLNTELAMSELTRIFLGLRSSNLRESLPDPAGSVALIGEREPTVEVGLLLPRLYRFFHNQRTFASISRAIRLAKWLARLRPSRGSRTTTKIAETVISVEHSVGISDCYPRALLTAYLCLSAKLSCNVMVGVLAPSQNMHAWCSTKGVIPYEPVWLNWWYSPLAVYDITP